MAADLVKLSKFLSYVLRHQPESIGLTLDPNGWVEVEVLLRQARGNGKPLTRPLLDRIVAENDKKRFAFSDDGRYIRASQGHSVAVDLDLPPVQPPDRLFHGTAFRFLESIKGKGLIAGNRQHIHLSPDAETARKVGQRHGCPVVLNVKASEMAAAGHTFHLSANGVWLTDHVPLEYLDIPAKP